MRASKARAVRHPGRQPTDLPWRKAGDFLFLDWRSLWELWHRYQPETSDMSSAAPRCIFRFGDFALDVSAYELRRSGRPIRLERQPMELLILLVERSRELVTREQIVARLWGDDIFVDVDTGVNTAIRKVRQALNVSSGCDPLVETVPGKGYRFVATVTVAPRRTADGPTVMLAVLPFLNLSADTDRDYVADGLTEDMIATLSQVDPAHLRVIGRTSAMAYKGTQKSLATIGAELKAQFLVEGSIPATAMSCGSLHPQ